MLFKDFSYKILFLPFIRIYIYSILIAVISSYFIAYENEYTLTLFDKNKIPLINLFFITASTLMFGTRSGLYNYIRHTMYINTVRFLFKNICLQNLDYWDSYIHRNELLTCMVSDVTIFVNVLSRAFSLILKSMLTSLFIGFTLLNINFYYFLFGIVLCVSRSYLLEYFARDWENRNDKVNVVKRELESHITDFIKNNNSFQLCGVNRTYMHLIDTILRDYNYNGKQESYMYSLFMLLFNGVVKFIDIGFYLIREKNESLLHIQIIISYFKILSDAIQNIADVHKDFTRNKRSINNVLKYIKLAPNNYDIQPHYTTLSKIHLEPRIDFKNVTFKYKSRGEYIFKNLHKTIHFKDKIAVIGSSGKGKSTLFKLLKGLYTPQDGYVLINNKDVTTMDTFKLNKLISVIPQEPVILFDKTLRENIELFTYKPSLSDKEIKQMLTRVELSGLIPHLDNKIVNLSGGQKQRLSIARALLSKTPILLLDEPFSALNQSLRTNLYNLIMRLSCNKTVIMITHDTYYLDEDIWSVWKI
jgi:ABC-type multidrug transport system fused ATPase/permease subunit